MMDVINNIWFSGGSGTVGFVLCYDTTTKRSICYTGCAEGYNEQADITRIKDWGAKVPKAVAVALFGEEKVSDYKYE